MASPPDRIDDLRRRVLRDPASIAFAQLAEEYRRAGQLTEAVDTCRSGLETHPDYASARVTLGRALLALGRLDEANAELHVVVASAPENLAATRALADTCRRQGRLSDAFTFYTAAFTLAPNDPDLERILSEVSSDIAEEQLRAEGAGRVRAAAQIAALEQWLEAIRAARPDRQS